MKTKLKGFELKATKESISAVYAGFSKRVNELLYDKGMGEWSVPALADYFGIQRERCRAMLTAASDIPVRDMLIVAEKLETTPDYLLFGADNGKPERKTETKGQPRTPSVYESMVIDRECMMDLLVNRILPELDDEEREAVLIHARLLVKSSNRK